MGRIPQMPKGVKLFRKVFILLLFLQGITLYLIIERWTREMDPSVKFGAVAIFITLAVFEGFVFLRSEISILLKEAPVLAGIRTRTFLSKAKVTFVLIIFCMLIVAPMLMLIPITVPNKSDRRLSAGTAGEMNFWVYGLPAFRQDVSVKTESDGEFDMYVIPYGSSGEVVVGDARGINTMNPGFPYEITTLNVGNITEKWRISIGSEGELDIYVVPEEVWSVYVDSGDHSLEDLGSNSGFLDNCTAYWLNRGRLLENVTLPAGKYTVMAQSKTLVNGTDIVVYRWTGEDPILFGSGRSIDLQKDLYPARYQIIIFGLQSVETEVKIQTAVYYMRPVGELLFLTSLLSLMGYMLLYIYARAISEGLVERITTVASAEMPDLIEKEVRTSLKKVNKKEFLRYLAEEADRVREAGNDQFKLDHFKGALALYNKGIAIDPRNAKLWNNKALAHRALEGYEEAMQAYERALEIDPGNEKFIAGIDACLAVIGTDDIIDLDVKRKRHVKQEKTVKRPQRTVKKVKRPKEETGMGEETEGPVPVEPVVPVEPIPADPDVREKPVEEGEKFAIVKQKTPSKPSIPPVPAITGKRSEAPPRQTAEIVKKEGDRRLLAGDLNGAIEMYERAVNLKIGYVAALNNLALAYRQAGRIDNSEQCYRKALEYKPNQKSLDGLKAIGRA